MLMITVVVSGCAGWVFPKYGAVNSAIKKQPDFVGLSGYELRKSIGSPTDIQVAWSDDKGLVQIFVYATTRGTISVALKDDTVIDVDYLDKFKK
jgi:hypothetical protein